MEPIDWKTVASYPTSFEANLAKARLEEEGIRVFVANAAMVDTAWHLSNATGGVRVEVPRSDVTRAGGILAHKGKVPHDEGGTADYEAIWREEPPEPAAEHPCGKMQAEAEIDRAFRAALLGLLFAPVGAYAWWLLWRASREKGVLRRNLGKVLVLLLLTTPMFLLAALVLGTLFAYPWEAVADYLDRGKLIGL